MLHSCVLSACVCSHLFGAHTHTHTLMHMWEREVALGPTNTITVIVVTNTPLGFKKAWRRVVVYMVLNILVRFGGCGASWRLRSENRDFVVFVGVCVNTRLAKVYLQLHFTSPLYCWFLPLLRENMLIFVWGNFTMMWVCQCCAKSFLFANTEKSNTSQRVVKRVTYFFCKLVGSGEISRSIALL